MKTVVIYKSETGFTKKYAEWIANDLSADIFDISKANPGMFTNYDTIIYGGSLHAVGISGLKFITQNLDKLKDKKIIVFATGASPSRKDVIDEIVNKNFTPEQQKYIKFFYMRGGFDYSKLKPFDKFLMNILKWRLKTKKQLTSDEKGLLSIYDRPVDFTNKDYIDGIIKYINS